MKFAVKTLTTLLLLALIGCGNDSVPQDFAAAQTITVVDESPFRGFYAGSVTCEQRVLENGVVSDVQVIDAPHTVIFSDQGIPIVDGVEMAPGMSFKAEVGGITIIESISSITTFGSGIEVIVDGSVTSDVPADSFTGVGQVQYLRIDDDSLTYTELTTMASVGAPVVLTVDCSGVLHAD